MVPARNAAKLDEERERSPVTAAQEWPPTSSKGPLLTRGSGAPSSELMAQTNYIESCYTHHFLELNQGVAELVEFVTSPTQTYKHL
jgi:hypothetical protein